MKIIFNGQLKDALDPQVQVSPLSAAIQFGESVFETFKLEAGRPPEAIKQHWERLFNSMQLVGITAPAGLNQVSLDLALATLTNQLSHEDAYRCKVLANADFWWLKAEVLVPPSEAIYTEGVVVDEAVVMREFSGAKVASTLYSYYQKQHQAGGYFETLYFDQSEQLLEGSVSNVIAVLEGVLVSPGEGVLPGITVRRVMAAAQAKGLKTEFRSINKAELRQASEIFLTNAIKGLVPVRAWGNWKCSEMMVYDQLKTV